MPEIGSPEFYSKLLVSAMLVLLGGAFAGSRLSFPRRLTAYLPCSHSLTLGLMGLDELHLRVLAASSDDPKEKQNAKRGMFPPAPTISTSLTFRCSSGAHGKGPSLGSGGQFCQRQP